MKKIVIAALAACVMAGAASAQMAPGQRSDGLGPGQNGQRGFDPAKMFDRIDTNHDGQISRAEFAAAHEKMRERRMERREMREGGPGGGQPMKR